MHRQPFTTNFASLRVIASSAIGLVDIWRPPRMKSCCHGSVHQLGITALNPERAPGRRTQDRTVSAFIPAIIALTFV